MHPQTFSLDPAILVTFMPIQEELFSKLLFPARSRGYCENEIYFLTVLRVGLGERLEGSLSGTALVPPYVSNTPLWPWWGGRPATDTSTGRFNKMRD